MSKKTFTCGYCFAYYRAGEGCGCKDAQFDRAKDRISALEGVVECADKWCDAEARWQAHLTHCDKCERGVMCSEEWQENSVAVVEAWRLTYMALSKLEEV